MIPLLNFRLRRLSARTTESLSAVSVAEVGEKNQLIVTSSARLMECRALIEGLDIPRSIWLR